MNRPRLLIVSTVSLVVAGLVWHAGRLFTSMTPNELAALHARGDAAIAGMMESKL